MPLQARLGGTERTAVLASVVGVAQVRPPSLERRATSLVGLVNPAHTRAVPHQARTGYASAPRSGYCVFRVVPRFTAARNDAPPFVLTRTSSFRLRASVQATTTFEPDLATAAWPAIPVADDNRTAGLNVAPPSPLRA